MPGTSASGRQKPTAQKIFKGTFRPYRARSNEPDLIPVKMSPPTWLSKKAAQEWRRLSGYLFSAGIITRIDRGVFAAYCAAYAEFWDLEAQLQGADAVLEQDNGVIRPNPLFRLRDNCYRRMMDAGARLGLDPANRGRIEATPHGKSDAADPFDAPPEL